MNPGSLSVFGLGKLGASMVGCFASAGYEVVGVDIDVVRVDSVLKGQAPIREPGLQELFDQYELSITATEDPFEAVLRTDVSFIIVPTPSTPDGEFFTTSAEAVAKQIGSSVKSKGYHLIVVTSTVLPGATENRIKSVLEQSSGKVCGEGFGLCYSPEFIAIGNVIEGLVRPDFFLIGEYDKRSGDILESVYDRVRRAHRDRMLDDGCTMHDRQDRNIGSGEDDQPPILRMNIVNAELTKIAVNTAVTAKISFANTICRLCARLPGADAHVVAKAVGSDSRIGPKYLLPGPVFGGPCFPRDNRAFAWLAHSLGDEAPSAEATDAVNRHQVDFLVKTIVGINPRASCIALLGLAYKPDTNLMEASQSLSIARSLLGRGYKVLAHDPRVKEAGATEQVEGLVLIESLNDCLNRADTIVLCTPHREYRELIPDCLGEKKMLVDIWRFLYDQGFAEHPRYLVPGMNCEKRAG